MNVVNPPAIEAMSSELLNKIPSTLSLSLRRALDVALARGFVHHESTKTLGKRKRGECSWREMAVLVLRPMFPVEDISWIPDTNLNDAAWIVQALESIRVKVQKCVLKIYHGFTKVDSPLQKFICRCDRRMALTGSQLFALSGVCPCASR